jgi:hypothetical protein
MLSKASIHEDTFPMTSSKVSHDNNMYHVVTYDTKKLCVVLVTVPAALHLTSFAATLSLCTSLVVQNSSYFVRSSNCIDEVNY